MPSADSVKTKIQGLIAKANATTGGTDTELMSAVNKLVEGYGHGDSDTYKLSGSWRFNDTQWIGRDISADIAFTAGGRSYGGIVYHANGRVSFSEVDDITARVAYDPSTGWLYSQELTFSAEQEVSAEFYYIFRANTSKISG